MKRLLIVAGILALSACSAEPGSEKWCAQKAEQSKSEWTSSDATTYAMKCLLDSTTIGSKTWCENLAERPKGDWTGDEATAYAKHCII